MKGTSDATPAASGGSPPDYSRMPKKSNTVAYAVVVVVILLLLGFVGYGYSAGWLGNKKSTNSTCTPETLNGAGSTFVYPLMNDWAYVYGGQSCTQVVYNGVGSGAGVTQLTQKLVDFGASDAPLNPTQKAGLPHAALTIPETIGAVTVVYNIPGVSKGLNLTGSIVAQIYMGQITTWNVAAITSINPGVTVPNQAIVVVHRSDSSGTTFVFTSFLSKSNSQWNSTYGPGTSVAWPVGLGAKGSTGVAGQVASTPGGIGYVELNYASTAGLGYAKVQNPSGAFILPNASTTSAAAAAVASSLPAGSGDWGNVSMINENVANAYPIATFSYVFVYSDVGAAYGASYSQAKATALVSFLWWIVHSGQSESTPLFYVPLPAGLIALDETTVSGVLYNGATLTSH